MNIMSMKTKWIVIFVFWSDYLTTYYVSLRLEVDIVKKKKKNIKIRRLKVEFRKKKLFGNYLTEVCNKKY